MGGGDLNLKKSWHPSTLRNIERVWKAEQKHEAEQQKIEQLQKELAAERAREDLQTYAQDKGVVKKKGERLDWMYQGPTSLVNREDYLMGRKIDKTFEILQRQENGQTENKDDTDGVPASVTRPGDSASNVTVDLATKIREDPLFSIMKREKEQRKNLLTNPVRMKQLKKILEKSLSKEKKSKNKKKSKKGHPSSNSSNSSEEEEEQKRSRKRHDKRFKEEKGKHFREKSRNKSSGHSESYSYEVMQIEEKEKYSSVKSRNSSSDHYESHSYEKYRSESHKSYNHNDSRKRYYEESFSTYSKETREVGYNKERKNNKYNRNENKNPPKKQLSIAEKDLLRQEMMDNAKWRDNQRKNNVERFDKESAIEDNIGDGNASSFIRPMLSKAAESGTVEGRVKQKIFTIQRKKGDMDKNFARR